MQNLAVSIADAIKITGISRSSLYRLIAAGKLTPRKLGKRTLLLTEDLQELVKGLPAKNQTSPPPFTPRESTAGGQRTNG